MDTITPAQYAQDANFSSFSSVASAVETLRPSKPLYLIHPHRIEETTRAFMHAFPGQALYAVKTNPDKIALNAIKKAGLTAYDVASIEEIACVKSLDPAARIYFMHPVKAPEDIHAAYFEYGVRDFTLDSTDELYKILRETDLAQDLNLFIRLALPKNESALIDFSSKFGAKASEALELLKQCRPVAGTLGLSFHVGTQTTDASRYGAAIEYVSGLLRHSAIQIDTLNIGGGFPVPYADGSDICTLEECITDIKDALEAHGLSHLPLIAEPGRYLVAQGVQLAARVELRKGDTLYINDGIYGGLFDACDWLGLQYPVKAISSDQDFDQDTAQFRLAGPTCDSLDMMNGPFILPADIGMGDWVIFENCGAYSASIRSNFNGFGYADIAIINNIKEFEA